MDITSYDYSPVWRHILGPLVDKATSIIIVFLIVLAAALFYTAIKYGLNPFRLSIARLEKTPMRFKPFNFLRWFIIDQSRAKKKGIDFDQFGLTAYCGRQGAGKTISMIWYLICMHKRFPDAFIVTNFGFKYATHRMESWRDLLEIRNGTKGVIFAIDEIHSEYSSAAWKDFPEELLSEISQQRKQRVKIVCTSQVFDRIAKPIREQCFSVVQCKTFANRWTFNKEYDAFDYEMYQGSASGGRNKRLRAMWKKNFIQSDAIRKCFDTYEKIERMQKTEFIPRNER